MGAVLTRRRTKSERANNLTALVFNDSVFYACLYENDSVLEHLLLHHVPWTWSDIEHGPRPEYNPRPWKKSYA